MSYQIFNEIAVTCRSFDEYVSMFQLNTDILSKGEVLDVASGASSFVAEASKMGVNAYAVDPIYKFTKSEIKNFVDLEIENSFAKIKEKVRSFKWDYYKNIDNLKRIREQSLQHFLQDYERNKGVKYIDGLLPKLPFGSDSFSLIVSSHFLFIYSERKSKGKVSFDYNFHFESIIELIRVCRPNGEIRLFPLNNSKWERYSEINKLVSEIRNYCQSVELVHSQFEFIPGFTQYLKIVK